MDETKNGQKIISAGKTTCACGEGCTCGCGHHCAHRVIWWVVGIVILGIVFCVGMKAGEFREELHYMYGDYYRAYPMMPSRVYNDGGVAVPVTGSAQGSATTSGNAPMIPANQ
jgi:hypothetical protein